MALNKVTYTDNVTVIGAANLNAIQDEVIANGTAVSTTLPNAIAGKVAKDTSTGLYAYTHNGGTEMQTEMTTTPAANKIPIYGTSGVLKAGEPSADNDVVRKAELDVQTNKLNVQSNKLDIVSGEIFGTYTTIANIYIGTNGKLTTTSGASRTICIEAEPNKTYIIKKETVTIMRAGCGSSASLTAGAQLVNYDIHDVASAEPLTVTTDDDNYYIYIQLFASSDSSSLQTIEANVSTLCVFLDVPTEIEKNTDRVMDAYPTVMLSEQSVASFEDGADDIPVKSLVTHITPIQKGSGVPTPDNVREIVGYTGVNVTKTGKNMFTTTWEQGSISSSGGNTASTTTVRTKGFVKVVPGVRYTIARSVVGDSCVFRMYDKDKNYIGSGSQRSDQIIVHYGRSSAYPMGADWTRCIVEFGNEIRYLRILDSTNDLSTFYTMVVGDEPLEPTAATQEESYNVETLTIPFGNDIGTVYGGTLDTSTGVLTVNTRYREFDGTEDWKYVTSGDTSKIYVGVASTATTPYGIGVITSNYFKGLSAGSSGTLDTWQIRLNTNCVNLLACIDNEVIADLEAWKTYLGNNHLQVLIPLANKETYQLTPTEVKTLLGVNNIFTDCGTVKVTYRADPTLYGQKQENTVSGILSMLATVEDGDKASKAYAIGKFFIRGGNFCQATAAIASGAEFTLGTNYKVTTVADELYTLAI